MSAFVYWLKHNLIIITCSAYARVFLWNGRSIHTKKKIVRKQQTCQRSKNFQLNDIQVYRIVGVKQKSFIKSVNYNNELLFILPTNIVNRCVVMIEIIRVKRLLSCEIHWNFSFCCFTLSNRKLVEYCIRTVSLLIYYCNLNWNGFFFIDRTQRLHWSWLLRVGMRHVLPNYWIKALIQMHDEL